MRLPPQRVLRQIAHGILAGHTNVLVRLTPYAARLLDRVGSTSRVLVMHLETGEHDLYHISPDGVVRERKIPAIYNPWADDPDPAI